MAGWSMLRSVGRRIGVKGVDEGANQLDSQLDDWELAGEENQYHHHAHDLQTNFGSAPAEKDVQVTASNLQDALAQQVTHRYRQLPDAKPSHCYLTWACHINSDKVSAMEGRLIVCIIIGLGIFIPLRERKLAQRKTTTAGPLVPAMYFFGDSTVDPGNNNELVTLAKANFPPYGRDFMDHKPTGRFTNGKLVTDTLSGLAGLPDIVHASLDPEFRGPQILRGASFASAASGYDDTTSHTMNVLTLGQQLENFKFYRQRLVNMVGGENASEIISGALFALSTGSDDFTNTYYINPITRAEYNVTEFQDHLLNSLSRFIEGIYSEDATLFGLISLPPFGCLPSQITLHNLIGNACVDELNDAAMSFNKKAAALLETLKPTFPGLKMAFIDIYDKLFDMITNPKKYGFEEVRRGCCGTGLLEASTLCTPVTPTCHDPTTHVFWDSFHPTEKTYNILAQHILSQAVSILHL